MSERIGRIALIGPTAPYRGGIAQYTTQLHRTLDSYAHVSFSFKRMYPMILYPGGTILEGTIAKNAEPGVRYSIDVMWPLSWRTTTKEIINSGCTTAVFAWWTLFWQPGFVYMARRLQKRGIKVVFLCHNVGDHDYGNVLGWFSKKLLNQADGYIVQTTAEQTKLAATITRPKPIEKINHPIYTHFPKAKGTLQKRGKLALLFFGFIRPYKGVELLVDAVQQLDDRDVYLTIVGEVWGGAEKLTGRITSENIDCHLNYVSEAEAAEYFARADVVVLPYTSATGSGVATLAYHYGKPILASKVDGLTDVVEEGKTGWLVEPNSSKALANAIANIKRGDIKQMQKHITAYCKANNWQAMANKLVAFCQTL